MWEIKEFSGGILAQELSAICLQTKTAAPWAAQEFESEAKQKSSKVFILIPKENATKIPIGFCCLRFVLDTAEITNFAISPSMQRRHLGTKLFAYALNFLKTKGVKEVTLEVSSANKNAQEFYKKFKFTCVNIRKKFYNMEEDALLLKVKL